jgi:FAD-linked sulfhydryl oxidase
MDCTVCTDFQKVRKNFQSIQCPPDVVDLGRSTWTFLHTMAAFYPESPTDSDRNIMSSFIQGLARFYPCSYCAEDLREQVKLHPPVLDSNVALSDWFCQIHNNVNRRLGKPLFDCSQVLQRWRFGAKNSNCFN